MKILKIIGVILIILVIGLGTAIMTLPSETHMIRTTMINAPAKMIYQDLLIMKNFNTWSPWSTKDPEARYEYFGPLMGEGSGMRWFSDNPQVGNGEMVVQQVTYPTSVTYGMDFGFSQATATLTVNESESGAEVSWSYDETGISGFNKLFAVMTETFLGPDYEAGLANLKAMMEEAPSTSWDMEIMGTAPRSYIGTRDTLEAPIDLITTKLAQAFGEILTYGGQNGIEQEGAPITVYVQAGEVFKFIPGIPMSPDEVNSETLMLRTTPEGLELRASYYGPYEAMEPTYIEMEKLISFYNMQSAGSPWEEYVTDPGLEPDPQNWLTYVHWPIQYKD